MKSPTIISVLVILFVHSIKAQDYYPFPTEDAHWNIYLSSTCDNDSPPDTFLLQYFIDGDTVINDLTYRKLCVENWNLANLIIEPVGGIREEEKRIYYNGQGFLGSVQEEELLLYDFTAQVGDTVQHSEKVSFRSIILEIDSIQINGAYRKRYKVDNGWMYHNPDYIVEGIGSIQNGLLGHISDIPTCGTHYWEHVCFRENENIQYLNPTFNDCNAIVLTNSILDKDKTWYNHIHYYMSMGQVNTEVLGFGADTIISDTIYAKVLRATGGVETPYQQYGYLREKSGQVFYRLFPEEPERILYDFTISEHGTIHVWGLSGGWPEYELVEYQFTCDSIRYVEYCSILRKVLYLSPVDMKGYNSESWVEGIGSVSGLLHNYDGRVGGDAYILSCVTHTNNLLFDKYETGECIRIAVGINNDAPKSFVEIYPNPTSGMVTIETGEKGPCVVMISGLNGQILYFREINDPTFQIDLMPFRKGIYIISVRSQECILTGKIVKL